MTSSPTTKLILVVLIALVTFQVASAELLIEKYEHDTTFDASFQDTRACSCGVTTDYFTLENRGDFTATYRLVLQSEVDWIELHRSTITLGPGERTVVPITLRPPCGEDDTTTYQVFATSQFGRYRVADRSVTAHTCENVALDVQPMDQHVLPCTDAQFAVTVRNTGSFDERYYLSADDEAVAFEETYVRLAPGEAATVGATARWACDIWGTEEITFQAHAQTNDLRHERTAKVEILWDYEFIADSVQTGTAEVCAEVPTEHVIAITNTGGQQNSYALSEDSEWAELGRSDITIPPGATEFVTLHMTPQEAQVGAHDITVDIEAAIGGAAHEVVVPVSVRDCYEHEVRVMPEREHICAGDANYTVQIINRGESTESFRTYARGDIFAEIIPNEKPLRPGEHDNRLLRLVVPDRDEDFTVEVHVEQTPGISSVTEVPFTAVSNARCTEPDVSTTDLELYTDTMGVPFIIENTGFEATTYRLGWEGQTFELLEDEVFLAPGEQAVVHIVPRPNVTLEEGEIIERFVLTSHRSVYRHDFVIELDDKGFFVTAWEAIFGEDGVDWCLLLMAVLIIAAIILLAWLILIYVGVLRPIELSEGAMRTTAYVLGILAAGFVLLAIVAAVHSQPTIEIIDEPRGTNATGLYHEILMSEEFVIDLSQYFVDPDDDELTFTASQPENLDVFIEGDTARIVPDRNWAGQEAVVFTAQDESGLAADSPIMTIRVLATRSGGFGGFVTAYCWMFDAILAALVILLLFGLLRTRPDTQLAQRYGEPIRDVIVARPIDRFEQGSSVPAERAPAGGTQVAGDVVAGDKVTVQGRLPRELYVASQSGKKVHRSDCVVARRIPKEKRVVIEGKKEALEEGYAECQLCQPFDE